MARTALTDARIGALRPRKIAYDIRDGKLGGFGVRVLPSGRKRFFVHSQHRGDRVWKILGDAATMSVDEARSSAVRTLAAIRRGEDPPRDPAETLFEAVAETVFERYRRLWKPGTLDVNRCYLKNQILPRFQGWQVADIDRRDVRDWFASLRATPVAADRSMPVLSVILREAEAMGLRPEGSNPCLGSLVAGLGVRVRPTGGRSYVLLEDAGGRTRRVSLGPVSLKSVAEARRECHARKASPEPQATGTPRRVAPLFRDFVEGAWKEAHFEGYKPSTRKGVRSTLDRQLLPAFGSKPLDRIAPTHIGRWFDRFSRTAPGNANHALDLLTQIINFAIARGHLDTNPARAVERNPRRVLTRFLSREEISRLHRVLDRQTRDSRREQADIIRLLLLTGCRRSEILRLRWSEVDRDRLVLADGKTGPRIVPLSTPARRVLERRPCGGSPFVFPSPRDPARPRSRNIAFWYRARHEAGIEDVRLHDLRHTHASHAVMNGVPVPVVSRLLGHSDVRSTLRYAHLGDREVEAAAERVGQSIAALLRI